LIRITPERQKDIIGVILILCAGVSLVSLVAAESNPILLMWSLLIHWLAGWGAWIIPFVLGGVGAYILFRRNQKLPVIMLERKVGYSLLLFNMLTFTHYLAGGTLDPYALADMGEGGGIAGALILWLLVTFLGETGAVLALIAWLIVSLMISFDISILNITKIVNAVTGLFKHIQQSLQTQAAVKPARVRNQTRTEEASSLEEDFVPFQTTAENASDDDDELDGPVAGIQTLADGMTVKAPAKKLEARWSLPKAETILDAASPQFENEKYDIEHARVIEETLSSFGAPGHVVEIQRGPTVTMFGVEPDFIETRTGHTRVRVAKIVSLSDDLALALAATRIRIQAPVPGRNYVGIEVPNDTTSMVHLREVIESNSFKRLKSSLRFALGKDVSGTPIAADLSAMPHLLIAGTTGSGKSVCVNTILSCLLMHNTPDDLRLILIDPKRVELTGYNGIPHLLAPVVVEPDRVIGALQWMMREMDNRYNKFAASGARNIDDYNVRMAMRGEKKLPRLVILIDELADLMMLAPVETQAAITRLAQMARATGLHLILATQRPSVDVITGLIKANFPARIAFAVASMTDSRVILDQPGAEHLLGRGDMLFQAPDAAAPVRLQGAYVSDSEIQSLVDYWRGLVDEQPEGVMDAEGAGTIPPEAMLKQVDFLGGTGKGSDPLMDEVTELIRREGRASISMLQRKMRIGYTRAARLIDTLEEKGIIGPQQANSQVRQVLDYGSMAPPVEAA
jgi:S-DNA-T family DNA segregation ATPase FtsK/SpoIIIE